MGLPALPSTIASPLSDGAGPSAPPLPTAPICSCALFMDRAPLRLSPLIGPLSPSESGTAPVCLCGFHVHLLSLRAVVHLPRPCPI